MNWAHLFFKAGQLLCISLAIFLLIFASEALDAHLTWSERIPLLISHLLPSLIVLLLFAISKKFPLTGGILLGGLGVFYIFWSELRFNWLTYLIIAGPLILSGVFFSMSFFLHRYKRAHR